MRGKKKRIKLTAEQAQCNYVLNGDIAQMPCKSDHLDNIDFQNPQTEEQRIKEAIKSLSGFGITAQQAFERFKNAKPEQLYGLQQ